MLGAAISHDAARPGLAGHFHCDGAIFISVVEGVERQTQRLIVLAGCFTERRRELRCVEGSAPFYRAQLNFHESKPAFHRLTVMETFAVVSPCRWLSDVTRQIHPI